VSGLADLAATAAAEARAAQPPPRAKAGGDPSGSAWAARARAEALRQ